MTLSNSQCIEVAEKVWKVKLNEDKIAFYKQYPPYPLIYIKEEVNSWQGFGRTVEAMASKYSMRFLGDRFAGYQGSHEVKTYSIEQPEHWEDMKSLIPATHLAALEAVKKEK